MNGFSRYLPWFVTFLGAVYLAVAAFAPAGEPKGMHVQEFAKVPVVDRGRVKPLDTVARTSLMVISNRQTLRDEAGTEHSAIEWLLDVMTGTDKSRVFRIENDQVLTLLELKVRPGSFRYTFSEIAAKFDKLSQEVERASKIDPKQQNLFDQKVLELGQHLKLYDQLGHLDVPLMVPPEEAGGEWTSLAQVNAQAFQAARERIRLAADQAGVNLAKLNDQQKDELVAKARAEVERARAEISPAAAGLMDVLQSYADARPGEFNKAVDDYHKYLKTVPADDIGKAGLEVFFNHFAPFIQCAGLYVVVFLLTCFAWVAFTGPLNRAAFWLTVLTLSVHTLALGLRMYLQGRPPVTNLYSSAVFIGWGCVIIGLVLEGIFKNGLGNVVAAVTGALTMFIAHHLAGSGDTLEMMQAVLDTNFWLATHVTCVTQGYTATFVAGFLGILFVVLGVFTPRLDRTMLKTLSQMIYGVICFATLLSFTGTVLGGIWADQSWGRFWGWDPKENGALLIVLWNALILHARWGGLVKQRGMAVLAIVGNMVTGWSWFGTNQLGVGLHAYGFNNTLAVGLTWFWASQIVLICIGLMPLHYWRSFAAQRADRARLKPRPVT